MFIICVHSPLFVVFVVEVLFVEVLFVAASLEIVVHSILMHMWPCLTPPMKLWLVKEMPQIIVS